MMKENYYRMGSFCYQEKEKEELNRENKRIQKKTVTIYDEQQNKIIIENWEIVGKFGHAQHYGYEDEAELLAVKSPVDGKIHLFDSDAYKGDTNIFDMALDDVKLLYKDNHDTYLVVTINGKKGVYRQHKKPNIASPNLITPIEFKNIKKFPNIIVYTSTNMYTGADQEYFIYDYEKGKVRKNGKVDLEFGQITLDEKCEDIVYGKKDSRTYVYNTKIQKLLLDEECDDIECLHFGRQSESYSTCCDMYHFAITRNNLKGLLEVKITQLYEKNGIKKKLLLPTKYDEIEYSDSEYAFYPKRNGMVGLCIQRYGRNFFVEADYNKVIKICKDSYALYCGDRCDIYEFGPESGHLIKNCQIFNFGTPYHADKKGTPGPYEVISYFVKGYYDNIRYLDDEYYELEKNGKKGVSFRSKEIISPECDTVDAKINTNNYSYFALGKGDFKIIKRYSRGRELDFMGSQKFEEINFLDDVMTLRTEACLLIYNYQGMLCKKLPASSQVSMIYRDPENFLDKKPIYAIDEEFYSYEKSSKKLGLYIPTDKAEIDLLAVATGNQKKNIVKRTLRKN